MSTNQPNQMPLNSAMRQTMEEIFDSVKEQFYDCFKKEPNKIPVAFTDPIQARDVAQAILKTTLPDGVEAKTAVLPMAKHDIQKLILSANDADCQRVATGLNTLKPGFFRVVIFTDKNAHTAYLRERSSTNN